MGSQEKPGLCDGIGKGQWLAFPHCQLGKKGARASRKNAHLDGTDSRASGLEARTNSPYYH